MWHSYWESCQVNSNPGVHTLSLEGMCATVVNIIIQKEQFAYVIFWILNFKLAKISAVFQVMY